MCYSFHPAVLTCVVFVASNKCSKKMGGFEAGKDCVPLAPIPYSKGDAALPDS